MSEMLESDEERIPQQEWQVALVVRQFRKQRVTEFSPTTVNVFVYPVERL